ncbi:MAG: hypothetical protein AAFY10_07900 [Pseudomonadota bacterium]
MASVCISIESDHAAQEFESVLREASLVSSDMIHVRTAIRGDAILKTVRTECPWALAIVRSAEKMGGEHD